MALGHAIAQVNSRWNPIETARVHRSQVVWDLWWTKRKWDGLPPSTSVSPAYSHSINFFMICNHLIILRYEFRQRQSR
jgi:hypothetical protein